MNKQYPFVMTIPRYNASRHSGRAGRNITTEGFSFIELIIGLALSLLISVALFNVLSLTQRTAKTSLNMMELDLRLALCDRLEKDITGAFLPPYPEKTGQTGQKPEFHETEKREPSEKPESKDTQESVSAEVKPVEKMFYATTKDKQLDMLTFITNNPVNVYQDADNTLAKPRMVRVVYRLQPEPGTTDSFMLLRQESTKLELKAFDLKNNDTVRAYPLITGIKACSFVFKYVVPKKETPKDVRAAKATAQPPTASEQPEEKKIEFKETHEWGTDVQTHDKEKTMPPLPQFATCSLTLWDHAHRRSHNLTLDYEIIAFDTVQRSNRLTGVPTTQPETPQSAAATTPQQGPTAAEREEAAAFISRIKNKAMGG